MKLLVRLSILVFIPLFGMTSCANEPNEEEQNDTLEAVLPDNTAQIILGKWVLKEGFRDGNPTETLADTFFEFSEEGKMSTNLGGGNEIVDYNIVENKISQTSSRFPVDYQIENISDSLLMLSMTLRDIPFVLVLEREVADEVE